MEKQINDSGLQQPAPSMGALQETEASLAFSAAYWAWICRERATAPLAEEFGLTVTQAAACITQITQTEKFRCLHQ